MLHGRTLTTDNLKRRGLALAGRCSFCHQNDEDIYHCFLDCSFSSQVWNYFLLNCPGRERSLHTVSDTIFSFRNFCGSRRGKIRWRPLFHVILWNLWLERNNRVFEGTATEIGSFIQKVKTTIWSWCLGVPELKNTRLEHLIFD